MREKKRVVVKSAGTYYESFVKNAGPFFNTVKDRLADIVPKRKISKRTAVQKETKTPEKAVNAVNKTKTPEKTVKIIRKTTAPKISLPVKTEKTVRDSAVRNRLSKERNRDVSVAKRRTESDNKRSETKVRSARKKVSVRTGKDSKRSKTYDMLIALCATIMAICAIYIIIDNVNRSRGSGDIKTVQQFKTQTLQSPGESLSSFYDSMKGINEDYVFWLTIPDTDIDLPVVQGNDNSYYLTKTIYRTKSNTGTLFLDCNNANDLSDQNTVIYGHTLYGGGMLSSLKGYKKQSFYESHPFIILTTSDHVYYYQVVSCSFVSAYADYRSRSYGSGIVDFIAQMRADSFIRTKARVDAGSHIITLSTCGTGDKQKRTAVIAVLLNPNGEEIDLSQFEL
ncbi:MAG: class B sortase [Eubacteriales bacterium]|nr:class B sortase [Eubacteriales bacterium]